jgi:hypothetical protein
VAGQEGPRLVIFFRIQTTVSVYPEHVELTCSGTFSRSEAFRVGERAFREAASAGRRSVLMDVRGVTGRVPSIFDRFDIGVHIAQQHLGRQPRVRLAILGHEPMIHPDRFGEIVARNRGADARVFTDEAEARKWLLAA